MINVAIFIGSFIGLIAGISFLIPNLTGLARLIGISEFLIAFLLMSGATSASELFIGVSSAIQGVPNLSFGNILGANFINIALVLGVITILNKGIVIESKISKDNFWLIIGIATLPIVFALDNIISRAEGLVLLVVFGVYVIRIMKQKIYFSELFSVKFSSDSFNKFFVKLAMVLAGLLLIVVFSYLLVFNAQKLAELLKFNLFSFGVVFVALVSTLPELIFGIRSWMLKHPEMTAGNSLGSIVFNSAFIVGLVSIIKPVQITKDGDFFLISIFLIASLLLFNIFIRTKDKITAREGFILFSLYLAFLAAKFVL